MEPEDIKRFDSHCVCVLQCVLSFIGECITYGIQLKQDCNHSIHLCEIE